MLGAQVLFSTAGVQSHYLKVDVPRLLGTGMRLRAAIEFHKEVSAPYYGLGNQSSDSLADHPGLTAADAFRYARTYPQAIVALTAPVGDSDLRVSTFARYLWLNIDPYPGSLLAQERPLGVEGGEELSYGIGLLLDTEALRVQPDGSRAIGHENQFSAAFTHQFHRNADDEVGAFHAPSARF